MTHHLTRLLLTFVALFLGSAALAEDHIDRQSFHQMIRDSMGAQPGVQDIILGPLKDGRFVRQQLEYIATGTGTKAHRDVDPACIQVDRVDAAKMGFAIDALITSSVLGRCDSLLGYFDTLHQSAGIDDMIAWDRYAGAEAKLAPWRFNLTVQKPFKALLDQTILALQMHELGHTTLHPPAAAGFEVESEADGFAAAVAHLAGLSLSGVGAFTALPVASERGFILPGDHPLAECRFAALTLPLVDWYAARPSLRKPRLRAGTPPTQWEFLPVGGTATCLAAFQPERPGLCDRYDQSFHRGVVKAAKLVNRNTGFEFIAEGNGRCAAFAE